MDALLRDEDVDALVASVAPSDVRGWFTPDVAMLELAVTALDLASVPGSAPLEYEGLRERYLPEVEFRGRVEHRNSQYALYAAACMRGGLQPDLLNDAGWWGTRLWIYAVYALVIYSRAAGDRHDTTIEHIARDLLPGTASSTTLKASSSPTTFAGSRRSFSSMLPRRSWHGRSFRGAAPARPCVPLGVERSTQRRDRGRCTSLGAGGQATRDNSDGAASSGGLLLLVDKAAGGFSSVW